MARLLKKPYSLTQPKHADATNGNYKRYELDMQKQGTEFQKLFKASEKAQERGELVGQLFGHPIADGCAWYLVVKAKPLTLQWVPYMDAWEAPAYVIRGLRTEDL
jgi:hypothetical protein